MQYFLDVIARILDGLLTGTPAKIRVHHVSLYGARADNRHFNDKIVITTRLESRQHRHLCARLDLEHTHRVAVADHVVHFRVFRRHRRQRVLPAVVFPDQIEASPDCCQHAETQHVDFQQPQVLEVIFLPLNDGTIFHRRVFDRYQFRQRSVGDDESANVL